MFWTPNCLSKVARMKRKRNAGHRSHENPVFRKLYTGYKTVEMRSTYGAGVYDICQILLN
jgi:hypothetical protein